MTLIHLYSIHNMCLSVIIDAYLETRHVLVRAKVIDHRSCHVILTFSVPLLTSFDQCRHSSRPPQEEPDSKDCQYYQEYLQENS